jgi:hypothetical protein
MTTLYQYLDKYIIPDITNIVLKLSTGSILTDIENTYICSVNEVCGGICNKIFDGEPVYTNNGDNPSCGDCLYYYNKD